jgi:glycosyltransferase involved in cell wall biosynthesis
VTSAHPNGARPRLAVAVTYPVHPPLGGGQVRAYNLYRGLARKFDVELVALLPAGAAPTDRLLAPGLRERGIPKSAEHAAREMAIEQRAGTAVTDVAMSELYALTPDYIDVLRDASLGARAVVACHPYTFPAIREVSDAPVWYEAQDVEASLKRHVLGESDEAQRMLTIAKDVERACSQEAELIWACSEEDRRELIARYNVGAERVLVVPNGVALDEVRYVAPEQRRELRRRLRIDGQVLAIFIASWHQPNVIGGRRLLEVAQRCPDVDFMIIGSVGSALAGEHVPDNLQLVGQVSAQFKDTVLGAAELALNPVTTGSGTNLKMLEYFAAGIPVVSSTFGARGLGVTAGEHYLQAEPHALPRVLGQWGEHSPEEVMALVESARAHVESRLEWGVIVEELLARVVEIV